MLSSGGCFVVLLVVIGIAGETPNCANVQSAVVFEFRAVALPNVTESMEAVLNTFQEKGIFVRIVISIERNRERRRNSPAKPLCFFMAVGGQHRREKRGKNDLLIINQRGTCW
jgi:hypothetical protein